MALGAVAATLCVVSAASDDARTSKDVVLAEVNGVKLTLADLEQKNPGAVFTARTNYYEAERKAIDGLIQESILQQQAKKEGLTLEQLLDKHVKSTIAKDPSEEALRVYYEGVDTTEPFEAVRDKIVQSLRDRRIAKAKTAYMESLRGSVSIILRLPPPRAPISLTGVPTRGASNAPITLVEYADFECPFCQQIAPALDRLEVEYKGKLLFAYKDYPLVMHANAEKAAEASHCAEAQGKFWEYHDLLLAEKHPEATALKNYARELKLDTAAFDKCLDTGAKADVVKTNLSDAQMLSLQGTPSFFVNGRYVSGSPSYERLRSVIEEELSAAEGQSAGPAGNDTAGSRRQDR